jgi:putative nucleotidyltransferase with HDIG domain
VELEELTARPKCFRVQGGDPTRSYAAVPGLEQSGEQLVFPIHQDAKVRAALVVGRTDPAPYPQAVLALGRQLADQLAVGLSNVALLTELGALSEGSMLALARTIDANSPWTAGHSERVTKGAQEIGRRLSLDGPTLDRLRRGGLLHDIGKIGVPSSILDKAGPLTAEERIVIQSHTTIGAEIIRPIAAFQDLTPLVRHHHELLDGSGYPDGLSGEEIPLLVRILTVADIFDALVSDRPYRPGLSPGEALKLLQDGAGTRYDDRAVWALTAAVAEGWCSVAPERRSRPRLENAHTLELMT